MKTLRCPAPKHSWSVAAVLWFLLWCLAPSGFAHAATNFSPKNTNISNGTVLPALIQPAQTIPLGERLTFNVSWMGIPVGTGELWAKEKVDLGDRQAYHVVATATTNEFLSKIYPLRDEVHSWIDAETMHSLQFEKKVSEGFYRAHERVRYDSERRKGYYESFKNGTKKEFDVHIPVHDLISAFYWTRRQPLIPGKPAKTVVNNGEKDYDLEVDALRREMKEMRGAGIQDLILIEPKSRYQGVMDRRGQVWVHLKNNEARTPVLVTFKTPFGPVVGALQKEG